MKITFDEKSKSEVLDILDKAVDASGYIVEKDNANQKVLNIDGEEVKIEEFAGIRKGSEVFIKNDLPSLMELSKI